MLCTRRTSGKTFISYAQSQKIEKPNNLGTMKPKPMTTKLD